jgi:hypothetical protein
MEAAKKFVDGDREAASEEIDKGFPEIDRGMGRTLISRDMHGFIVEQSHFLHHLMVLSG